MPNNLVEFLGWIPAIIFPTATVLQLVTVLRASSSEGASATTWGLFGIANLCLYAYAEKYGDLQSIVGMLGTGLVDFAIVLVIFARRRPKSGQA